jgi:hypothetical protein
VRDFLSRKRLAVAGVSRNGQEAANAIFRKLRDTGHEVFPVNPNAGEIEGTTCYPDLRSIPGGVEGVVIATAPAATDRVVRECAELGIPRVWMHRAFGAGSVSREAVRFCRAKGITVIDGACPMMYCEPVDPAHRCIRWFMKITGGLPRPEKT